MIGLLFEFFFIHADVGIRELGRFGGLGDVYVWLQIKTFVLLHMCVYVKPECLVGMGFCIVDKVLCISSRVYGLVLWVSGSGLRV